MKNTPFALLGELAQSALKSVGFVGLLIAVFAESGLLIGFFLPGDSLLFAAGLLSYTGVLPNIWLIAIGCAIAAVAGDQVGYYTGQRFGPSLFTRPDSRLFKQRYLTEAEEFFERHGSKTILFARLVPIVRTFAPIVAGAGKMHYRRFVVYNVIGGVIWAFTFTFAGYLLGQQFPGLADRLELVVVAIVAVSLIPMAIHYINKRRKASSDARLATDEAA
jgi:membrane-associated protein